MHGHGCVWVEPDCATVPVLWNGRQQQARSGGMGYSCGVCLCSSVRLRWRVAADAMAPRVRALCRVGVQVPVWLGGNAMSLNRCGPGPGVLLFGVVE